MTDDDLVELQRVHPELSAIVLLAYRRYRLLRSDRTFKVTSGYRTRSAQAALVRAGKSQTMASYHLDGLAVDLAILTADRSAAIWELDACRYLNEVMQRAAQTLHCRLTWGGDWIKLRDGVHWQLEDRLSTYPALIR